jgi:hypothetical protein
MTMLCVPWWCRAQQALERQLNHKVRSPERTPVLAFVQPGRTPTSVAIARSRPRNYKDLSPPNAPAHASL